MIVIMRISDRWSNGILPSRLQRPWSLFAGLINNKIDLIATDHAPHLKGEKENLYQLPFRRSAHSTFAGCHVWFFFSLKDLCRKNSWKNVPRSSHTLQNCQPGFIRKGYWPILCLLIRMIPGPWRRKIFCINAEWSPFEGWLLNRVLRIHGWMAIWYMTVAISMSHWKSAVNFPSLHPLTPSSKEKGNPLSLGEG